MSAKVPIERKQMTEHARQPARRRFLQFAAMVPASLGLSVGRAQAEQAMIPTAADMEGPYYIANMPMVDNLNRFGKPGVAMRIAGQVMNAAAPEMPVPGARLEIWQTDGTGRYHPEENGDYGDFRDDQLDLRGTVMADAAGQFAVMSLIPKEYWPRPPHIHYRVSAPGFRTLITQHYLDTSPRDRPHRTANVMRDQSPALFQAPTIYIEPV
jgi:protocatechuate 3,4-dioxygenase beta subunit